MWHRLLCIFKLRRGGWGRTYDVVFNASGGGGGGTNYVKSGAGGAGAMMRKQLRLVYLITRDGERV